MVLVPKSGINFRYSSASVTTRCNAVSDKFKLGNLFNVCAEVAEKTSINLAGSLPLSFRRLRQFAMNHKIFLILCEMSDDHGREYTCGNGPRIANIRITNAAPNGFWSRAVSKMAAPAANPPIIFIRPAANP